MLSEHTVRQAAKVAGITASARYLESTGSTNADLLAAAAAGAPDWSVEVAGHQEAGRGRLGRTWVDRPGTSLLVSVLLRPALGPPAAPLISLAAAAAMAAACESAGVAARCKWPNDVMAGERKLCGILPEASVAGGTLVHVVVGAGLNVAQGAADFPADVRSRATSVALEGGTADPVALLTAYLRELRTLCDRPSGAVAGAVLAAYRARSATLGRPVRATVAGGIVEGVAVDVGPAGELLVDDGLRIRPLTAGEVEHLR